MTTHSDYVSLHHLDDMELSSIQELANNLSTMNDSQTSQCQRHSDYEYPFGYEQISSASHEDSNGRSPYCISVWASLCWYQTSIHKYANEQNQEGNQRDNERFLCITVHQEKYF